MTTRRGTRASQVRPRPATSGRPAAATRPQRRDGRLPTRAPVARSAGLPLGVRIALVVAVVTLGIVVLSGASGFVVRAVGGVGGTLSSAIGKLTADPSPAATHVAPPGAPTLQAPVEAYTNQKAVDVSGTIPAAFAGQPGARIRLYLALGGKAPAKVAEQAVGPSVSFTFPGVQLSPGTNTFTATILSGATESEPSAAVSFVLDTKPPPLSVTSPHDGTTVNRAAVTITGRTQARSQVVVHDADSNATANTVAGADGSFSVSVALDPGTNAITVASTDPAGNAKSVSLTVVRGSGKLTASISADRYRFSAAKLPTPLTVRVLVLDPDGHPLAEATATFTIAIPGLPVVTSSTTTDATGRATFTTTIPNGAMNGTGLASVLVHDDEFGDATDRTVITITK